MRCKDAKILINEYLDGTLNEAKREVLFAHIICCAHCKEEFEQLNALKSILKNMPDEVPPKGLFPGAIEKAKSVASDHKAKYFPRRAIAGIAAAVVITIGAVWYFSNNMQFSQSPADMAAPKAETAMESPTPATLMQAAPQVETAAPYESIAASSIPPAASAARNGDYEEASLKSKGEGLDMATATLPAIEITIGADKANSFYDDLMTLIEKNNIPYIETEEDDSDTVFFTLEEMHISAMEALLKKYDIEQTLQVPVVMNFMFKKL